MLAALAISFCACSNDADTSVEDTVSDGIVSPDISPDIVEDILPDIAPETDIVEQDTPIPEEDSCAPDCENRLCGEDGCGGSCGVCTEQEECLSGQCTPLCVSDQECSGSGLVMCNEEGDAEKTCEEVSPGCFQFGSPIPCAEGWACIDNACQDQCLPLCPPDWCGEDGCGGTCAPCSANDKVCVNDLCELDEDSDGYPESIDCDDSHPGVNPGQEESYYDGLNNDCDDATVDGDADGDGALCICVGGDDCDDTNPSLFPASADWVGDNTDHNCDGHDGIDADQDFYASIVSGGLDCDDTNPAIHPGVEDFDGDGIDFNCDGVDGYPPPGPADEKLCVISGQLGDTVDCPLSLVREDATVSLAAGLQMSIHYNPAAVSLVNFFDEICDDNGVCIENALTQGGSQNNATGHTFATYPFGTPESAWEGTVNLLVLHLTDPQALLSSAILAFNGDVIGDSIIGVARFELLVDVDSESPTAVEGKNLLGVSTELLSMEGIVNEGQMVLEAP